MSLLRSTGLAQKKFGNNNYQLKLLPARQGLVLGTKLVKLLGTSIGVSVDSGIIDGEVKDYSFATNIAVAITSSMDRVDVVEIVEELLSELAVGGTEVEFDTHFRGNYGELMAVVQWSLHENFGDFISGFLKAKGIDFSEILTKLQNKGSPEEKEEKPDQSLPK
jgi:hypothetical protein